MYLCKICNNELAPPPYNNRISSLYTCDKCLNYSLEESHFTYNSLISIIIREFIDYGNFFIMYIVDEKKILKFKDGKLLAPESIIEELTTELAKQYLEELKIYNVFS